MPLSGKDNQKTTDLKKVKEDKLLLLAQKGDKQATEILLTRYAGLVRGRARGFFLIGGETEDLIQEGMVGLYHAISTYRPDNEQMKSFKNYAVICVSSRIKDAIRASARKKNIPLNTYVSIFQMDWETNMPNPEEEMIRSEDRQEFLQKLNKQLSDFEFRVMVLYLDGFKCTEICEITGKDSKSVDNAIQRSKKKLQKVIMEHKL